MTRALSLALAMILVSSPAFAAGSCWRDQKGEILSFSDKDWSAAALYSPGKATATSCGRSVGDAGPQMDCGGQAAQVGMAGSALQYAGHLWRHVPCGAKVNHDTL